MIISPIEAAKSEMDLRICRLLLCLDEGRFFCSQKRKSVDMVRLGFGEAISFSPSVSFTLMNVYMNTEIK